MWSADTAIKYLRRLDGIRSSVDGRLPHLIALRKPPRLGIFHADRDKYIHKAPCVPPNLPIFVLAIAFIEVPIPDLMAGWIRYQADSIDAIIDQPGSVTIMPDLGMISVQLHRLARDRLEELGIDGFHSFTIDSAMYGTL